MLIHITFIFSFCLNIFVSASDVVELSDVDFSSRIQDYESALVMFYAPWCGHCKKLKPEFDKASSLLLENDPPVTLAKVDCTEGGKETCNRFSVTGYPTLKIFKDGDFSSEYNGPREAGGIVKYMKSQVGPSAKTLNNQEQLETFLKDPDVGIVGFFNTDSSLKETFLKIADKLRNEFRFAITTNEDLIKTNTENGEEAIILFRPKHLHSKFEPTQLKYDGANKKDEIIDWLQANKHGLVDHRQRGNVDEFKNPLIVAYYNVDYIKNPKGTNYWRNRILKVAQNYASDFTFAISLKDDFQHELNEFGYDYVPSEKPIVFARSKDNKKYGMQEEFSVENFENFIKKLKAGELEPYLKSEPVPESNDKPVKIAVAKNFDELVTNNDVDTFIEFYAPWCGHCKKLAPIWDELGEKMANEDVQIVKMDATSNDVPSPYDVRGFPSLYWVPKNNKDSPQSYSGGRDLNDFIKYIAKHATNELKGYDRSGNPKSKDEL